MAKAKNNQNVITVDLDELCKKMVSASKMVVNQKAEKSLSDLLEMQIIINDAVETVKTCILREAKEYNENITCIKGKNFKINFQKFGNKYEADGDSVKPNGDFWTKRERWSINSSAVDKYYDEYGKLPEGIKLADRKETAAIKRIEND